MFCFPHGSRRQQPVDFSGRLCYTIKYFDADTQCLFPAPARRWNRNFLPEAAAAVPQRLYSVKHKSFARFYKSGGFQRQRLWPPFADGGMPYCTKRIRRGAARAAARAARGNPIKGFPRDRILGRHGHKVSSIALGNPEGSVNALGAEGSPPRSAALKTNLAGSLQDSGRPGRPPPWFGGAEAAEVLRSAAQKPHPSRSPHPPLRQTPRRAAAPRADSARVKGAAPGPAGCPP